ncbi:hypothetical protein ACVBEJ_11040 [Porticoccus sp. GXU_MW_L64]
MFTVIAFSGIVFLAIFRQFWKITSLYSIKIDKLVNILCMVGIILAAGYLFYPHFKNLTRENPEAWTKRESPVSEKDVIILKRAAFYLEKKENWDRSYDRFCLLWVKKSLFCAIALAQKEVDGKYIHGSTSIQHVRYVIDDNYKSRWKYHPIMEFNNHPDTTYEEVKFIINEAIKNIEERLNRED